jgi:hypothetical protein
MTATEGKVPTAVAGTWSDKDRMCRWVAEKLAAHPDAVVHYSAFVRASEYESYSVLITWWE